MAQAPFALFVVVFCSASVLLALYRFYFHWRTEGTRAFGIASFVGAGIALGLLIAEARGAYPYRMPDRYAIFSVMPLLGAIVGWELYGPVLTRKAAGTAAAMVFAIALPFNVQAGFAWRDWYVEGMKQVQADIDADMPVSQLAHENVQFLLHDQEDNLRKAITELRDAGIGPFRRLTKD